MVVLLRGWSQERLVDLGEQSAEVGRLGDVEAAGAVLGRQAEGIAGAADEAADLPLAGSCRQPSPSGSNRLMRS